MPSEQVGHAPQETVASQPSPFTQPSLLHSSVRQPVDEPIVPPFGRLLPEYVPMTALEVFGPS